MNIYQLIHSIESISSGPSYSVAKLSQVLSFENNVEIISFGKRAGVDVSGVKFKYISEKAKILSLITNRYRNILSTIYSEPNAILHGHAVWRAINLAPLYKRRGDCAKIVWSPRGSFSTWSMNHHRYRKLPFWLTVQKPAMQRVDCFHATAESEYISIRRLGFRQPVSVIPNGIDIFPKVCGARDKSLVFWVGYISRRELNY